MRKIIILTVAAAVFIALPGVTRAGVPEAITYLKTQALDDWTAMALVAAGEPAVDASPLANFSGTLVTDYAKRILSLVAAQKDPATFTPIDLVVGLKNLAQGGQLGDASLLNDDAWGVLALRAAGVSASDSLIQSSVQYMLGHQNTDGGWGYAIGGSSDTNDTAAVIMALLEAGVPANHAALQSAVAYFVGLQKPDGGFPYEPSFASDSASTAWVISALTKLGQNPASWLKAGNTPVSFLLSLQTSDGSFKWQAADPQGSQTMTAYAVVALSNQAYPVRPQGSLSNGGGSPNPLTDLKVSVEPLSFSVAAGSRAGYRVTVENRGVDGARAVEVRLPLQAEWELVEISVSQGSLDKLNSKWVVGRLAAGEAASFSLSFMSPKDSAGSLLVGDVAAESLGDAELSPQDNKARLEITLEPSPESLLPTEPKPQVLGAVSDPACDAAPKPKALTNEQFALLKGKFLVTSSDSPIWYVEPESRKVWCVGNDYAAQQFLGTIGLGITNANLALVPGSDSEGDGDFAKRLSGRILLRVETGGEAWYVRPDDGLRYYLHTWGWAFATMRELASPLEAASFLAP